MRVIAKLSFWSIGGTTPKMYDASYVETARIEYGRNNGKVKI